MWRRQVINLFAGAVVGAANGRNEMMHVPNSTKIIALLCLLFLTGCKEPLYSDLGEAEANEMTALLARSGIVVSRERDKDNLYTIMVESSSVAAAVEILRHGGYPKVKFQSLGDVFAPQGIVSTPFEQRARFIHALNEELAQTISAIHGIRSARVHVMIPESDRYEKNPTRAQASVVLYFEPGMDLSESIPKIKELVAHSVQGLEYDGVSLATFVAEERPSLPTPVEADQSKIVSAASYLPTRERLEKTSLVETVVLFVVVFFSLIFLKNTLISSARYVFGGFRRNAR